MDNKGKNILDCNCRNKKECSMGRRRKFENVVYEANIFSLEYSKDEKVYIGISSGN